MDIKIILTIIGWQFMLAGSIMYLYDKGNSAMLFAIAVIILVIPFFIDQNK